jgi:hypothetical protein
MIPRIVRFRDAPRYLGMGRNRFNVEVRPHLTEIPIGLTLGRRVCQPQRVPHGKEQQNGTQKSTRARPQGGIWHIDKLMFGRRICQSTSTPRLEEAERTLARVMEEVRQVQVYGVRRPRSFEQAAAKYMLEHQHKRSLRDDISRLSALMPWFGQVQLDKLHMGVLQPWIEDRKRCRHRDRYHQSGAADRSAHPEPPSGRVVG